MVADSRWWAWVALGPACVLVGIAAIGAGISQRVEAVKLEADGVTVPGLVLSHEVYQSVGHRGTKSYSYKFTVQFTPTGSRSPIARKFSVSAAIYSTIADGSSLDVIYLPTDPSVVYLVGQKRTGYIPLCLGLLLASLGAVTTLFAYRELLLKSGGARSEKPHLSWFIPGSRGR